MSSENGEQIGENMGDGNGGEGHGRTLTTPVVVEKEVVKEALAELLGEIPAFKSLLKGKGPARTGREEALPHTRSGPADAGTSGSSDAPVAPRGDGKWSTGKGWERKR